VTDQFGVVGGFRERGKVSAERLYPGDSNGTGGDQNKRTGVTPSRRTCAGIHEREHEQEREEQELPGNPPSPAFKKSSHRIWQIRNSCSPHPVKGGSDRHYPRECRRRGGVPAGSPLIAAASADTIPAMKFIVAFLRRLFRQRQPKPVQRILSR
jgi:hypothetical protein